MGIIYLPFGTVEGQTARIAEYLAYVIQEHGHKARTADLQTSDGVLPPDCDGVIVGASVHMGKHEDSVTEFVKANKAALERLPSALFSVSLAVVGDEERAEGFVEKFEQETGWRPAHVGLFAGALLYTQYGFFKRHMMKRIAGSQGSRDTDLTRDYVYTEWDGVRRFAEDFLAGLPAGTA